jgi:hypothetical protein
MKRLRINNVVRAACLTFVVWGATASAEEPQGRPGVIREPGGRCFQLTDNYGDFRDSGREIPCDDRYKEGEEIANLEFMILQDDVLTV